jgi:tRNA threonylcarbamoyladenosine biosynthesis protein TsaB
LTILALDTSSQAASCSLWKDGVLVGESFVNVGHTHSQTAMPMVRSLLEITGTAIEAIDLFAVSTGPGSFTGLRIGVAAVKGMALGLGKPCAAVSTLECLAENISAFTGILVPAMDARREQVYTARFHGDGGVVSRLTVESALSLPELRASLLDLNEPVMLVGDGAQLCKEFLSDLDFVRIAPQQLLHQRAASIAAIAARMNVASYVTAGELAPAYLRLPQAERERMARLDNRKKM